MLSNSRPTTNSFGDIATLIAVSIERILNSRWLFVVITLLWLLFSTPSLLTYPAVDSDEALFSSVGRSFHDTGNFWVTTSTGSSLSRSGVLHGRLYSALLNTAFELLGVGLFQGRVLALLGSLMSGLLVKNIAQALGMGRLAQAGAMLLFWTSWRTFFASHSIRPEMWIVVSGLLMIYLHLRSRRTPTWQQYLIFGFISAYLIDIHVPVVFYSAVAAAWVLIDLARKRIGFRQASSYAVGAALGLAAWAVLWLLPDPMSYMEPWSGGPLSSTASGSIQRPWLPIDHLLKLASWLEYNFINSTRAGVVETVIIVMALFYLVWKRDAVGNYLLICLGLLMLSVYVTPYLHNQHAVLVMPFLSLMIARAAELVAFARLNIRSSLLLLLIGPLFTLYVVGDISLMWRSQTLSFSKYTNALRQFIPPGANVFGEGSWWFEFYDGHYVFDAGLPSRSAKGDELYARIVSRLGTHHIDYVLFDGRIGSSLNEPYSRAEEGFYPVYEQVIEDYCEVIGEVDLPYIGVERGGPANKHTTIWHCSFEPS